MKPFELNRAVKAMQELRKRVEAWPGSPETLKAIDRVLELLEKDRATHER